MVRIPNTFRKSFQLLGLLILALMALVGCGTNTSSQSKPISLPEGKPALLFFFTEN